MARVSIRNQWGSLEIPTTFVTIAKFLTYPIPETGRTTVLCPLHAFFNVPEGIDKIDVNPTTLPSQVANQQRLPFEISELR